MARVSCKHCSCNKSFTSESAMLQHFADSHARNHAGADPQHLHVSSCGTDHVVTGADRLQCHQCGRSFNSKPALEQHCRDTGHDRHGIAAMVISSPPQQTSAASRIRRNHQLADVGNINDILSHRLMAAMLISGGTPGVVGSSRPLQPSTVRHDHKDQIDRKEMSMTTMKKVSCDDCGDSFSSFDALHQHQWDKPYHTRVSRRRMPVFGSNIRECSQCVEVFNGAEELEQHFIRAHPVTEITFNKGDERSTNTWMHVAEKFKLAWKRMAGPLPVVHKILKVNNMGWRRRKYEEYRAELKREMAQICKQLEAEEEGEELDVRRRVLDDGNELERYHGTTVKCDALGRLLQWGTGTWSSADGADMLCSMDGCGLCGILKNGFRTAKCRVSRFQRFGRGTYVSATSSKADDYVRMSNDLDNNEYDGGNHLKVMLACKVLAGRMYRPAHNLAGLSSPPPGFHSVQGVPGIHSLLNYDELVVYDDRAILPNYLIFYSLLAWEHLSAKQAHRYVYGCKRVLALQANQTLTHKS